MPEPRWRFLDSKIRYHALGTGGEKSRGDGVETIEVEPTDLSHAGRPMEAKNALRPARKRRSKKRLKKKSFPIERLQHALGKLFEIRLSTVIS